MNKKDIRVKKALLLVFALLLVAQINFMGAKAAVTSNPWGVNTSAWTGRVTASNRGSTYFSVNKFERDMAGARIKLKTTGSWAFVAGTVSRVAAAPIKEGVTFTAQADASAPGYYTYVRGSGILYY